LASPQKRNKPRCYDRDFKKGLELGKITYPTSVRIWNFKNSPPRRIKQFKISTILHLVGPKLFFQCAGIMGMEYIFNSHPTYSPLKWRNLFFTSLIKKYWCI
jgi:hypothetical protein